MGVAGCGKAPGGVVGVVRWSQSWWREGSE